MCDLDLCALHDDTLEETLLEEVSRRAWHPMHGPALLMRQMEMSHLVRSLRFMRRNLERVLEDQETTLDYATDKWGPQGFTGYEGTIAFRSALLDALILEVHRRLRCALRAGHSISAEASVNLTAADLVRPDPAQVQIGNDQNFSEEPSLPAVHPQDNLTF